MKRGLNSQVTKKERKILKGKKLNKSMKKKFTKSLESSTRKKIDFILNSLGWNINEDSTKCNVFTERTKTVEQKKKLQGKFPDYVLYEKGSEKPIAIIEAKRKGESIEKAIKQAIERYAKPLDINIVFAVDGTFVKSWHLSENKELSIDNEPLNELISERKLLRFIKEGSNIEEVPKEVKHTREELIRIFEWANNLLRKEGLRNLDRFIEFSNLLFIKIISEIEEDREKNGLPRQLDKHLCWDSFSKMEEPQTMLNYINNTVLRDGLAKEYNHSDDIFQEKLKIRNPQTVKEIVSKLSKLKLLNTESEIKGDAFEYFLKNLASGNDLGEYFTPRHLVKLMVNLVNPKFGNIVFDPFCGTGGFLIEAFRHIKKGIDEKDKKLMKKLREESIFGIEWTDTYKIAKMNMIITGDGHNNIIQEDTGKNEYWNNSQFKRVMKRNNLKGFNVILSNIPYGQTTDYGDIYPIPSNQGDSVFMQNIILALENGGKAGVVVPEGFLFKNEHKKVREYLLQQCDLEAVISLPAGVFMPYTMAKTNILIFEKGKSTKKTWFYIVENDGFELATKRRKINKNDIPDLVDKWQEKPNSEKSWNVKIEDIKNNDFIIEANAYKPSISDEKHLVKFSEFLREIKRPIKIEDNQRYKQVKVKLYGKGATLRKIEEGKKILTKTQFIAKENDLIISKIDSRNGAFAIIEKELDDSIVSSDFPLFEINEGKIRKDYLKFFIKYYNLKKFVSKNARGTTNRQRIKVNDFLNLEIPLPELKYQDIIIERLKKQEAILKNLDETLNSFKECFIDKIEFEKSEKIYLKKISDLTKKTQYGMTKSVSPVGKGSLYLRITDIDDFGRVNYNNLPKVPASIEEISRYKLNRNDFIIARSGSIGKCALFQEDSKEVLFASYLIRFIFDENIVEPKYIMYYLLSNEGKRKLKENSTKTTQTNINASQISSITIPLPDLNVQRDMIKIFDARLELISNIEDNREKVNENITEIIESTFKQIKHQEVKQ